MKLAPTLIIECILTEQFLKDTRIDPSCATSSMFRLGRFQLQRKKVWSIWIKNNEGEKAIDLEPRCNDL